MKSKILEDIQNITKGIIDQDVSVEITKPTDKKFGDYTSNIAFKLSKAVGISPIDIAKQFEAEFSKITTDYKVEIASNGFLNFTIRPEYLQKFVSEILVKDRKFGKNPNKMGQKVQIEFISANPTGPLTLGNGRGGFMGDVIANVLDYSGYDIEREYYVNDTGNQVKILGYSVARELGLVGEEMESFYAGSYIKELAKDLKPQVDKISKPGDDNFYQTVGQLAAEILLNDIKRVVKDKLKIQIDNYYSEKSIYDSGKDRVYLDALKKKKLTLEKDGALFFKTTDFGDDKDRVLVKADGEPTYFLSDVVHKNEAAANFDSLVLLLGADHYGYQDRLQAALDAFGHKGKLVVIIFQLVRLIKDGAEVKMSKRAGTYVALEDLVDQVGVDVARFFFLMFAPNTHMDFDLDLALKKSSDNPVYYVQYAHARIASILDKAGGIKIDSDFTLLKHEKELNLIRQLYYFPELVNELSRNREVQRLPYYALGLAESFHQFYQDCQVITDNKELTAARIGLVKAAKITLRNTLGLMGISAPEKM